MSSPVLLYDGLCGFCDGLVQWVIKRDPRGSIRFATLQGEFARAVLARHPHLAGTDSLVLVENPLEPSESVLVKSDGALRLASHVGGIWSAAGAFRVVPRFIRDAAYDAFARIRYRVFGKYDACPVPTPEQRARFIDERELPHPAASDGASFRRHSNRKTTANEAR